MRGRRRRDQDLPDVGGPSERAAERLRADVSRDVADLRLQLEEASLRSDAFLWAGYPDAAAEVVEEKRQLVSRFEARLQQRLSEAAVEAEAERIVAAAPDAVAMSPATGDREVGRHAPALLSALAAALLALVAVSGPVTGTGELSSADGEPSATDEHEIAALPEDHPTSSTSLAARPSPAVPDDDPISGSDTAVSSRGADDLPEASPTERLVGMIHGIVGAADEAVRDALRVFLAEADPLVRTDDAAQEPSSTSDDATADSTEEPHEDSTEEPREDGTEDGSEDDDLSPVTPPLDMRDDSGDAHDDDGSADEHPAEG